MVDTGKREDRLLDYINDIKGRITMTQTQIEIYRERALTEREIEMLNTLNKHLMEEPK